MNIQEHKNIVFKSKWFILAFTVIVAVAAVLFAQSRPTSYKAVVTFDLNLINRPEVQDYQYGGYYDYQAAEAFSQHMMSSFQAPAFVENIYKQAGVGYAIDSLTTFTNRFKTHQYSSQRFDVSFSDYSEDNARKLAEAIVVLMEEQGAQAAAINGEPIFEVSGLQPVVAASDLPTGLAGVVGLIVGLIVSMTLVYIRFYLAE